MNKLSIIIPCYNCERTLREAVDSCYKQNLDDNDFEIVMVDDGSTDGTKELMQKLKNEHSNIRLIFHENNRGGGAARNTGIKESEGKLIYCLDSDNIFSSDSLSSVIETIEENGVDGAAFYERRFFVGKNIHRYTTHYNKITERNITLSDLLNDSGILLDNFMYTREAFERTAGYPENHGFDTQCFEVRFLSVGNTVRVAPTSTFLHRQAGGKKSYFERVYESGEFSLNMYYIFEEIAHLLSNKTLETLVSFDVFNNSKLGERNLKNVLESLYKDNEYAFFIDDYKKYLSNDGRRERIEQLTADDKITKYLKGVLCFQENKYQEAYTNFLNAIQSGLVSQLMYFNTLRSTVASSSASKEKIESETLRIATNFSLTRQRISLKPSLFKKIYSKLKKKIL